MHPHRLKLLRAFATLLAFGAVAQVATLLAGLVSFHRSLPESVRILGVLYGLTNVTALIACLLALALVWRSWHNAGARVLALFLAFLALSWGSLFRFTSVSEAPSEVSAQFTMGDQWLSVVAFTAYLLALAAFLRFSVLFPGSLTEDSVLAPPPGAARAGGLWSAGWRWLRGMETAVRRRLFRPGVVWGSAIGLAIPVAVVFMMRVGSEPLFLDEMERWALPMALALIGYVVALPLLSLAVGVANLRAAYTLSDPKGRRRMLWVVTGFVAALWAVLIPIGVWISSALGLGLPPLFGWLFLLLPLAPLILVLCLAVAIFFSGAVDPALVIRKTTVYGALGALFVFLFAGLGNLVEGWVESALGLPGSVGSVFTGGAIAVVLLPLRGRVSGITRRWMPEIASGEISVELKETSWEESSREG